MGGIIEVPNLQNIGVNAEDTIDENLILKESALTEILPILCIRLVSTLLKHMRNVHTFKSFTDDAR